MSQIRLKCGIGLPSDAIERILSATVSSVVWAEQKLDPASGMEELEETVFWPNTVNGVQMPSERIAFYRVVFDPQDGYVGYSVESLADSVLPGKTTFERNDFQILPSAKSQAEAEEAVLTEVKRFLRNNI